jgi:hypothetical protein
MRAEVLFDLTVDRVIETPDAFQGRIAILFGASAEQ